MPSFRGPGRVLAVLCLALISWSTLAAQAPPREILLLLSFDGWRADYIRRFPTPNLHALISRGARVDALIPSFPTLTYPNHYTIVTGLYPDHHGIVGNTIVDLANGERFTTSTNMAEAGRWWGGEPLWATAQRQGLKSATMFWPGSESPIGGVWPTDYVKFDDSVSSNDRADHVLRWLSLPDAQRPAFVTAYFSETDHAGHDFGPNSPQVRDAVAHLDAALGRLLEGVKQIGLLERTNIVVVSDHGMGEISDERTVFLDDYVDMNTIDVIEWQPLTIVPKSGSVEDVYRALHGKHPSLTIYRKAELPAPLHYGSNTRVPPIIGLSREGWTVTTHERLARRKANGLPAIAGQHGFDNRYASMNALFVAAGPGFRKGVRLDRLENIHLYDMLCRLLGIAPAPNDGNPTATRALLTRPS